MIVASSTSKKLIQSLLTEFKGLILPKYYVSLGTIVPQYYPVYIL
jgi:hypothetical protein